MPLTETITIRAHGFCRACGWLVAVNDDSDATHAAAAAHTTELDDNQEHHNTEVIVQSNHVLTWEVDS